MNKVLIIGRFARDPELRYTTQGTPVANMTIAVNRPKAEEGQQSADFVQCVAWGKNGENITKYMKKGSLIGIEGRIQISKYQDKEGATRWKTEVVVASAEFLGNKPIEASNDSNDWKRTEYGMEVEFQKEKRYETTRF